MIVLDTNIISETSRPRPNAGLVRWLSQQVSEGLYLADITITELFYGGEKYRLKTGGLRYLENAERLLTVSYAGRVLCSTSESAMLAGKLRARREMQGYALDIQDAQIAATCICNGATLATATQKTSPALI